MPTRRKRALLEPKKGSASRERPCLHSARAWGLVLLCVAASFARWSLMEGARRRAWQPRQSVYSAPPCPPSAPQQVALLFHARCVYIVALRPNRVSWPPPDRVENESVQTAEAAFASHVHMFGRARGVSDMQSGGVWQYGVVLY